MNKREDILKLFRGENPEYVPWFGDLDYWIDYLVAENRLSDRFTKLDNSSNVDYFIKKGIQDLHRELGVGFYLQGYFPYKTIYHNLEYEYEEKNNIRKTSYKTPVGNLQEIWEYIPSTYSWAPRELLIKTCDDIAPLKYIYENTEYQEDYELAESRKQEVGSNGLVLVYTPKTPFMELVALRAGIETVVELYMDVPEELEELLDTMLRKLTEAVDITLKTQADCIMVPDNLSSEVVGGMMYDTYIKPVHQEWTEKIRAAGKVSFVHLDGTLTPLLTELSKAGFDVIEAVTPKPVGDVALEDLRSKVLDRTIIWGGIPGGYFSQQTSEEDFREYVIKVIRLMRNNNRFVLGVADQVVPGASFERIKMVHDLVLEYGKYD